MPLSLSLATRAEGVESLFLLSLATRALRRWVGLKLCVEGLYALILTLSLAARALRRCGAFQICIEGVKLSCGFLRQRRAGLAPQKLLQMASLRKKRAQPAAPSLRRACAEPGSSPEPVAPSLSLRPFDASCATGAVDVPATRASTQNFHAFGFLTCM